MGAERGRRGRSFPLLKFLGAESRLGGEREGAETKEREEGNDRKLSFVKLYQKDKSIKWGISLGGL